MSGILIPAHFFQEGTLHFLAQVLHVLLTVAVDCICRHQIEAFGFMVSCDGWQTKWSWILKLGSYYFVHFPYSPQNAHFIVVANALVFPTVIFPR